MRKHYVEVTYTCKLFVGGKLAIVAVDDIPNGSISEYAKAAGVEIAARLCVPKEDVTIIDYRFLGDDVLFMI